MAENNNIPEHWEIKKLGEVCAYSKGKMPQVLKKDKSKECTIPYINIKAFEKGIFAQYTDGIKCNLCNDDDLLMVWDGARCGMIGKAKKGAVGSTLMKILPTKNIHKEYLYHFINSKFQTLNTKPKGVGIPHIEPTLLWNFELFVPPLPEQQAIVSKIEELLSDLENGKQRLQTARQQLKVYRQSLLKWAFEGKLTRLKHDPSDLHDEHDLNMAAESQIEYIKNQGLDNLPERWKSLKLKDITLEKEGLRRGPFGSAIKKEFFVLDGYKVYEQGNAIKNDPYRGTYFVNETKYQELIKFKVIPLDLIVSCSGVTLGRICEIPTNAKPGIINQALLRIRLKHNLILNQYFVLYFRGAFFQKKIFDQSQGTAMPNLVGIKDFKEIEMLVPPIEQQKSIIQELESKHTVCDKIEETISHSLQQAETLWQSILKKAFEGRLV